MKLADAGSQDAWQPLTPPGVAAFAAASLGRLVLVQLVFAALAGISITTFLTSAWFPTIAEAIRNLPEQGNIRSGQLAWTGESPAVLANDAWLAITVDFNQNQSLRLPSDVQVEFTSDSIRFLSLAGYMDTPYPTGYVIDFNQLELGAWWEAREPFLAAGAGLAAALMLMLLWPMLAAIYAVPAGAVCRFVEHGMPFGAVWKMCCAAQLPGTLLVSFTLLLYSLHAVDLVQWLFVAGSHLLIGWVYIFLATFFIPRKALKRGRKPNPFKR